AVKKILTCFIFSSVEGVQVGPAVLEGQSYFPWGTRRGDRLVPVPFRCVPVPPVPPFGTTLMSLDPFEYHLYALYHPRHEMRAC
ncbi:MAG: hypothetical protein M3332_17855, partial [Actinomycetota bacterium]|nr:hypothetical protein [Actinomycetota bacterium]